VQIFSSVVISQGLSPPPPPGFGRMRNDENREVLDVFTINNKIELYRYRVIQHVERIPDEIIITIFNYPGGR
jgi:hypothetical protein